MFATLLLAAVSGAGVVPGIAAGPAGDSFYSPPALTQRVEGSVIWAQRFSGGAALPSAAVNYRMLYESIAPNGDVVAVSGTLAIPPGPAPPDGWPLISWAHGTVGDAPQCAPSRSASPNIEQRMLDGFVKRGYAVAQTDYLGNGTPGVHPFFVAASAAHDVTDIALASRRIDPEIGRKWIAMGHSEGGAAALSTAAFGQQWAGQLDLVGAVGFAPASHMEDILRGEFTNYTPNGGLVFLGLLLVGFSTADPHIVPSEMLEPNALALMPALQQRCYEDLAKNSEWPQLVPRSIFRTSAEDDFETFYRDLLANDPENQEISIPVLIVQGVDDPLIPPAMTDDVRERLCKNGTPVSYKTYPGATHGTVLANASADVAWIAQRFSGIAVKANC